MYLLNQAISYLVYWTGSFSTLAFGAVSPSALIIFASGSLGNSAVDPSLSTLFALILLVNSPQVIFSTLYFLYNRCYTCMLSMDEWATFAIKRQPLRVSRPTALQRSTYWLQLPYLYSIPLLVVSGLMHWIISQSLFLVRIRHYNAQGQPAPISSLSGDDGVFTLPGYSPKAIIAVIVLGIVMLLVLLRSGFRRFKSAMPLLLNNSWIISAACHAPAQDEDAAYKALMWGAVGHADGDVPGHCCFTSQSVDAPVEGGVYT
jgi:hypothetical protein